MRRAKIILRLADLSVGVILLVGALSMTFGKNERVVSDLMAFCPWNCSTRMIVILRTVVVMAEAWLGIALVVRPKHWVRYCAMLIIAVFTCLLISRGITTGWATSCHCLDVIGAAMLPLAILRNALLIALLALACASSIAT